MFFSVYASFRWAGTEHYLVKIAGFVLVASLLSAHVFAFVFGFLGWDSFALVLLMVGAFNPSFPFLSYNVYAESRLALPPPYNISQRLRTYEIRVPALSVLQLLPHGFVERSLNGIGWVNVVHYRVVLLNTEIGTIPPDIFSSIGVLFAFFLLMNLAGALLGFALTKLPLDKLAVRHRLGGVSVGLLARVLIGVVFVVVGVWFPACLWFGLLWLAMIVVEEEIL
jgi:hypothetical protein